MRTLYLIPAVLLGILALVAFQRWQNPADASSLDFNSLVYRPIVYSQGDILDYDKHAFVSFDYPLTTDTAYLNIKVTNLANGEMSWLVRNIPIAPASTIRPIYYRMDMAPIAGVEGNPPAVEFAAMCGEYQLTDDFIPEAVIVPPVEIFEHSVPPGVGHIHSDPKIPYFEMISVIPIIPETLVYIDRGCEVPNIDLDSLKHNDNDTDDIDDSDWNACGPAAAANSLKWMMETDANIDDVDSLRGILDTLKKFMHKDTSGTQWDSIVSGKLAFIDKHMLPIRVKYQVHTPHPGFKQEIKSPNKAYGHKAENQTGEDGIPSFEWICSELAQGEDVEVGIQYWCPDPDNPDSMIIDNAHFINLTGYAKAGNDYWLKWKHDPRQQTEGGPIEEWGKMGRAKKPTDDSEDPDLYPMLSELSETGDCIAFIGEAISESYDPDVTFCTKNVTTPDDSGPGSLRDAINCNPDGATVTFSPDLEGDTITITGLPLQFSSSLQLEAGDTPDIVIRFETEQGFVVPGGSAVTIEGLNIVAGTGETGSALNNNGVATLENVNIYTHTGGSPTANLVVNKGQLSVEGQTNIRKE